MNTELAMHNENAPIIPSYVFLGEIADANGFFPNAFPNSRPPLSHYHAIENMIVRYLGL
jgi:hypothetical protein